MIKIYEITEMNQKVYDAFERLLPQLKSASIHQEVFGSDHCPVEIIMEF